MYIGKLKNDSKTCIQTVNPVSGEVAELAAQRVSESVQISESADDLPNDNTSSENVSASRNLITECPEVYVYVDEKHRLRVPSNSLLEAVDACFKIIYILEMEYPPEVKHIWQCFQYVFNMLPDNVHKYGKVKLFINNLNDIQIIQNVNPAENIAFSGQNDNEEVSSSERMSID